ncbi:MAG: hypothetical protein H0U86_04885 [Chloroflexi bacterium]|nr:hypothetical protein [Chloroflexota bacterium]
MRAAAFLSVAIIAIGAYLMIAASLNLTTTAVAFGVLAIATTTAIAIVGAQPRSTLTR